MQKRTWEKILWQSYALLYDSIKYLLPYQELLERAIKELDLSDENIKVLDAGCGTGNLEEISLKTKGAGTIISIDRSPNMLKQAQRKFPKNAAYSWMLADLDKDLPLRDRSFHYVTSINVLYTLKDPEKALKEIRRILRPGGTLILATPKHDAKIIDILKAHFEMLSRRSASDKLHGVKQLIKAAIPLSLVIALNFLFIKRMAQKRTYHFFNADELRNIIEKAGFELLKVEHAYGDTALFVTASKILAKTEKKQLKQSFEVKIADSNEELEDIFKLRYRVYCEEMGSLAKKDYPEKKERDKFDEYSIHIIVRDGKEAVGTLRLIKNSPWGFLMEDSFKLPDSIDRTITVEHSRGMIKKDYRGLGVYGIMLDVAYQWQINKGYTIAIGAPNTEQLAPILERKGWKKFGKAKEYHNITAVPMIYHMSSK